MKANPLKRIEVNQKELESILAIAKAHLTTAQYKILESAINMIVWLQFSLKEKSISIARLRHMFFGKKTESYKNIKRRAQLQAAAQAATQSEGEPNLSNSNQGGTPLTGVENTPVANESASTLPKNDQGATPVPVIENIPAPAEPQAKEGKTEKKKGHGRRSINDYVVTKITHIILDNLKSGCSCPSCEKGKVYYWDPETILVFKGQPPLKAEAYCAQRLRCNLCGAIFRAKFPKEVIMKSRADYSARAIVCLAKYQLGTPLYRLETWQYLMNIPISDSEMWEWTESVALALFPIHQALLKVAAKGDVIHNDDTTGKILDLMAENDRMEQVQENNNSLGIKNEKFRKGIYASILLSKVGYQQVAIYATGRRNAGENLDKLLDHRPEECIRPIQSCDASAQNAPECHETDMAKCFNHARHNFCELLEVWPNEALATVEMINTFFMNDRLTKGMHAEDRLKHHQKHSAPVMEQLYNYCNGLLDKKVVEPNSGFGKAINYLNNHKIGLSLFLRDGNAPLSNNDAERAVKSFVLIRKNSYFYKSCWGAFVGDILLSTIKTCGLNNINPYDFLVAIQANVEKVAKSPDAWLPWNYTQNSLCPYVNTHSVPVEEIYQPNGPPIVLPTQVDLESQKKTFRERARDFFRKLHPRKLQEV